MPNYTFGGTSLNSNSGGLGLFFQSKNLDTPVINPVLFNVARRDGAKKSGETVSPREIDVLLQAVGSSRSDLISRLDALQQGLALRSQQLVVHEDTRYFQSVDCVSATASLGPGNIVSCPVQCKFIANDPYAYANASSSNDTGTIVLTASGSLWNFPAINIVGGGTYYSYPFFHIVNKTSTGSTTLTAARNSGTAYTTLAVNATSFSGAVGDDIQLSSGGNTQIVVVATAFSVGATTITVTSFTANATYGVGATAAKVTQWTSISIAQSQDSQTLSANSTSTVALPNLNNDFIDIQCDPATTGGMSIQTNNSGLYSDPQGVFPVVEPGTTTFNISIGCASAVSAQCVISWKSRYVS